MHTDIQLMMDGPVEIDTGCDLHDINSAWENSSVSVNEQDKISRLSM
jgi:hypothetical protein